MDLLYLVYTWIVKYQVSHLQYWGLQGSSVSGIHLDSSVLGIPWIFCIWYTPGQFSIMDTMDLLYLVYTWIVQYQVSHGSSVSGIHLDSPVYRDPMDLQYLVYTWIVQYQGSHGSSVSGIHLDSPVYKDPMDPQYLEYTWIVQYIGIPWIFSIWYTPGQFSIRDPMDLLYLVYTWIVQYQVSYLQYWGSHGSPVSGIHLDSSVLGIISTILGITWISCIWYTLG